MGETAGRSPGIRFDRVSVELGGHPVLAGLDLTIERGEALVLLGRSGSGKSTTLRLERERTAEAEAEEEAAAVAVHVTEADFGAALEAAGSLRLSSPSGLLSS